MAKPTEPKPGEPITLLLNDDGTPLLVRGQPRYRVVLDGPPHADGKRRQVVTRHPSLTAARSHVQAHRTDKSRGVLLTPDKVTFEEYAAKWLDNRSRKVRETTARSYKVCIGHGTKAFGKKPIAKVTRLDVEAVVSALVGDDPAKPLKSRRRVQLVLFTLRSVFEDARHDGLIARNPAARIEATGKDSKEREALSPEELTKLRTHFASDPLSAVWSLTLLGLRRSEVLALRWSDVDFKAGTVTIERSRVDVDGKRFAEGKPKTKKGHRTLLLPADVMQQLRELREQQMTYGAEQARNGYLAIDVDGEPMRHEHYSDAWRVACAAAGVQDVTLHAARHSSVTAMIKAGVPDYVVAAWHGHDINVMRGTYLHADDEGLAAAGQAFIVATTATS